MKIKQGMKNENYIEYYYEHSHRKYTFEIWKSENKGYYGLTCKKIHMGNDKDVLFDGKEICMDGLKKEEIKDLLQNFIKWIDKQ